ncbi:MAG: RES family NAD+ phosphorylase [Actinomycetia bacterium]|nr:RES family NAD+ phosphorylase [Actinomycetes bacterium]
MIDPIVEMLKDGQTWLRVADAGWDDPLDPSFAQRHGGRWNPPASYPTLYLNEDVETARSQIHRMLEGSPVRPEDLDERFVLVAATLPSRQRVADAVTDHGLASLGLATSYPLDDADRRIEHAVCQPVGEAVHGLGLRGVHTRSASPIDGVDRELAWFPARASSKATLSGPPIPFHDWYPTRPATDTARIRAVSAPRS